MSDPQPTIDILIGQIEAMQKSKNNLARLLAGVLEDCEGCINEAKSFLTFEYGGEIGHDDPEPLEVIEA